MVRHGGRTGGGLRYCEKYIKQITGLAVFLFLFGNALALVSYIAARVHVVHSLVLN